MTGEILKLFSPATNKMTQDVIYAESLPHIKKNLMQITCSFYDLFIFYRSLLIIIFIYSHVVRLKEKFGLITKGCYIISDVIVIVIS